MTPYTAGPVECKSLSLHYSYTASMSGSPLLLLLLATARAGIDIGREECEWRPGGKGDMANRRV